MPRLRRQSSQQRSQLNTISMRRYRERNLHYDRLRNSQILSVRRQNEEVRENERDLDSIAHSTRRRWNPEVRRLEQERNTLEHTLRRSNSQQRILEQSRNTLQHAERRRNEVYRQSERIRDAFQHFLRRSNPEQRTLEQSRNTLEHAERRRNEDYRLSERIRDASQHSLQRSNLQQRALEQSRNTREHAERRENSGYREVERERDMISHSNRRSDPNYRTLERLRNTELRRITRQESRNLAHDENRFRNLRVRIHRLDPSNRERENTRQSQRNRDTRRNMSPESRIRELESDSQRHIDRMLRDFNINVKKGPTDICVCCGGLWFPHQTRQICKSTILRKFPNLCDEPYTNVFYLSNVFPSENDMYKFCNTCFNVVSRGGIPTICLSKGLNFPEIPNELQGLTALEERFVAPRIPFMRIVSLGYNRQCAVRGAVVNVPISLSKTVDILPRTFDQTEVIQVYLKRKLEYNHSFMTETIRPSKIFEAANYLVDTDLYRSHGIKISEQWLNNMGSNENVPFVSNMEDREIVDRLIQQRAEEEDVTELNPQETLIENDPVENRPLNRISIAPGQGERPLDMILDKDSEELSFPSIYCGIKRSSGATIGNVIKSETRRYDRRCARVDKVLYS